MDAIETLMNEHRVIERVLDALVGFADEVRRSESTEKEELSRFVSFVREFADRRHHGKEEDILFAAMVEHGFPREAGPIAVMLHEHDRGRALVGALAEKARQEAPWSPADRQDIADFAHGFSDLLRAHIHKEDAILYPMAEQRLPADALDRVSERCEEYEAELAGAELERYQALADELIRRHAATTHPPAFGPPAHRFGGCCG